MPFDAADPLFRRPGMHPNAEPTRVLYDSTDASVTRTDIAAVAAAGGNPPKFTTVAGNFAVFAEWQFALVSGFTGGSTAANGIYRVVSAAANTLEVSGGLASLIPTAGAGDSVTIRRVRLQRVTRPGENSQGGQPQTLQATSGTNLSGTLLQLSLNDGATWDPMPDVVLPDPLASNAKVINFFVGNDALLRLSGVPSNFSGQIFLG